MILTTVDVSTNFTSYQDTPNGKHIHTLHFTPNFSFLRNTEIYRNHFPRKSRLVLALQITLLFFLQPPLYQRHAPRTHPSQRKKTQTSSFGQHEAAKPSIAANDVRSLLSVTVGRGRENRHGKQGGELGG
jgi:hypothetical protein